MPKRGAVERAVVEDVARAAAAEAESAPRQLGLLDSFAALKAGVALPGAAKRRGRPPGAVGRRDLDLVRYVEHRYGNALVKLAEIYSRDTLQLAAWLGCERAEALKIQVRAAEVVAPYLVSKRPAQVEVRTDAPHLMLYLGGASGADGAREVDGEVVRLDRAIEQYQQVSDGVDAQL